MQRALWRAGWNTLVDLSSLFLTHCLTFVSTPLYLVNQRSRREGELDKWMGQTHICTSVFARSFSDIVLSQPRTLTLTFITKCWTLCPNHSSFNSPLNLQIQNILILPKCADETHILLFAIGSSYRIKITIALCIYHLVIRQADG